MQKARAAIRTLYDLVNDMKTTGAGYKVPVLEAHAAAEADAGEKPAPAFSYFNMTVDIEGAEEILGKITKTANELETELRELTEKIYMGIEKEKPRE